MEKHTDVHESTLWCCHRGGEELRSLMSEGIFFFFTIKMSDMTAALLLRSQPLLHYTGVALSKTGHQILESATMVISRWWEETTCGGNSLIC